MDQREPLRAKFSVWHCLYAAKAGVKEKFMVFARLRRLFG